MLLEDLAGALQMTPVPAEKIPVSDNTAWDVESILGAASAAGLAPELAAALRTQAARLTKMPLLAQYFHTAVPVLFGEKLSISHGSLVPGEMAGLTEPEAYAFRALLILAGIPTRRRAFAADGLPEDAADKAAEDVFIWMAHFYKNLGFTGLSARIAGWDYGVMNGYPLTLGRMQYILKPFHDPLFVYRNTDTGEVVALAGDGMVLDRNGLVNVEDEAADAESWTARLTETGSAVTGYPVHPGGRVLRTPRTLDLARWKLAFKQGDWTLDTHIPEGPDLKLEDCRESMIRALAFFRERYPEREIRSFSCLSWLLDPQYETILKPGSRIVAWMRQYYLFPIAESGADALWRVFGENWQTQGLANVPRQTSMQKNVAAFLEQGGKLRSGGGFLLPEDLAAYGQIPYPRN